MISQLTVFLENEKGRLAAACRAVSDAGINMHALNLADTSDFGVVRMLTDTPEAAAEALRGQGYRATVTRCWPCAFPTCRAAWRSSSSSWTSRMPTSSTATASR